MGRTSDTREKLIDAAMELVWRSSYGSVSVDDICKTADVRKGSFYHYFKSKVDLAVAAMEDYYQNSTADFDRMFSPSKTPLERFDALVESAVEKQTEVKEKYGQVLGCPFMSIGSEMAGQEESIRDKADRIFRRYERYYESAIRDMIADGQLPKDTDAATMASEVYSYIMGQVMMARVQNSLEPLKRDLSNGIYRILGVQKAGNKVLETA